MSIAEAASSGKALPLAAALDAGVGNISYEQAVTFTKYMKVILPLDGYVFWVAASILSPSAKNNDFTINGISFNASEQEITAPETFTVKGSLHYATENVQDEAASYGKNRVVFTARSPVDTFNEIGPNILYIGVFNNIQFSWSSRGNFYRQADLYHYMGDAIYAPLESQIINDPRQLQERQIVSNSLPIWMAMSNMPSEPWASFGTQGTSFYPSYLSQPNMTPPYVTVHITPDATEGLSATPLLGSSMSHDQLSKDNVRLTLYGFDNSGAMNLLDFICQQSVADDAPFGIMNIPIVKDEKQVQTEIAAIAMKKTIDLEVDYYQSVARDIARQTIKTVIIATTIQ